MKRKPYRFFLYILLRLLYVIILILPYRVSVFLGSFFGGLAYRVLAKYRNITLDNLRSVFKSEKSDTEIRQIAGDVFCNIGRTTAEYLGSQKLNKKSIIQLVEDKGTDNLKRVFSEGKGVIGITGHIGNWEMAAAYIVALGFNVVVIARRIYYPPYNKFLVSLRNAKGVEMLYRDDKNILKKCLEVLRSNKLLAILPDQDVDSVNGVFVDFFGRPAYTPAGPVKLAMLSGAPIMPMFMVRKNGGFRYIAEEPIYVEKSSDRKQDIIKYTQIWSGVFEKYIREYPSQWAWMHKRWKTQPKVEQ